MKYNFTIRDLLASPFMLLSFALANLSLIIGGKWTAYKILKTYRKSKQC